MVGCRRFGDRHGRHRGLAAVRANTQQKLSDSALQASDLKLKLAREWASMSEVASVRHLAANLSADPAVGAQFKKPIADAIAQIAELQKQILALPLTQADQAMLEKIAVHRAEVLAVGKRVRELKEAGNADEARLETERAFLPASALYMQSLRDFAIQQEHGADEVRASIAEGRRTTVLMAGVMVLGVMVATVVGAGFLIRSIKQPLNEAIALASRIAQGDLSAVATTRRTDEFGQLMQALGGMTTSLSRLVAEVRQTTDGISTASNEIATGNQDLSMRTEQTASSLQETASSMEQLTGTVQHSAQAASEANQLASTASDAAQRGGAVVGQVVHTMQEIAESSKRIADIIGVIDSIAFQTNILALNAAVEAARAGEQGRGFAVVASEVRSLAHRSAEAAKEIKGLISVSTERVDSGAQLVGQAGNAMQDIVGAIQRVTDMMRDISTSSAQQSSGIVQVNQAVSQLDPAKRRPGRTIGRRRRKPARTVAPVGGRGERVPPGRLSGCLRRRSPHATLVAHPPSPAHATSKATRQRGGVWRGAWLASQARRQGQVCPWPKARGWRACLSPYGASCAATCPVRAPESSPAEGGAANLEALTGTAPAPALRYPEKTLSPSTQPQPAARPPCPSAPS